jgi:hypothetical protein
VPSYVHASIALVAATIVIAVIVPTPEMHPARAGAICLSLMAASAATFLGSLVVIVLAMVSSLPGYVVLAPALAALGVATALALATCWMASSDAPDPPVADADGSEDDDGGGGGGGLRPEDEPPKDPNPTDGIDWDHFDRERSGWETVGPAAPERELVEV